MKPQSFFAAWLLSRAAAHLGSVTLPSPRVLHLGARGGAPKNCAWERGRGNAAGSSPCLWGKVCAQIPGSTEGLGALSSPGQLGLQGPCREAAVWPGTMKAQPRQVPALYACQQPGNLIPGDMRLERASQLSPASRLHAQLAAAPVNPCSYDVEEPAGELVPGPGGAACLGPEAAFWA